MEPEDQTQPRKERVVMLSIISLVVIAVVIVVIVIFARDRVEVARQNGVPIIRKQTQVESTLTGRLGLSLKGDTTRVTAGQKITLFIYADSQDTEITGYDAVMKYDSDQIKFESVKSVLDGMDIYETEGEVDTDSTELIITGVQSLGQKAPFVFNNTALAEVTFTVLTSGTVDIELVYEPGSNRESNLMTSKNQDILSMVVGTTLDVK